MPETIRRQKTYTLDGETYVDVLEITTLGMERVTPSVAAAKAGALTTRTDNDTGVATLSTGHGIATNNVVDVFWTDGGRYGMTATVATNAVTVDGGAGDNLPVVNTTVAVVVPTVVGMDADGSDVRAITVKTTQQGRVVFLETNNVEVAAAAYVLAANGGEGWIEGDATNPVTGKTIVGVKFSHSATTGAKTMTAAIGHGTPS